MEMRYKQTPIPQRIIDRWQQVVDTIADLLSVPSALINRVDPAILEVIRGNTGADNPFPSGTRMELAGVFCESAVKRRKEIQVADVAADPQWRDSVGGKAGVGAYLGFPLFWPKGGNIRNYLRFGYAAESVG